MSSQSTVDRADGSRTRRRKFVVHPAFQWKIAGWLMADVFAVCAFMGVVMYGIQERFARARALNPGSAELGDVMFVVICFALAFAAFAAVALGVFSFMMTHRICGPLRVIQQGFDELAAGRIPTMRPLRKKDEFKDFHGSFRTTLDAMKTRRQTEISALTSLIELARNSAACDEETKSGALQMIANDAERLRRELATSLGHEIDDTTEPPAGDETGFAEDPSLESTQTTTADR